MKTLAPLFLAAFIFHGNLALAQTGVLSLEGEAQQIVGDLDTFTRTRAAKVSTEEVEEVAQKFTRAIKFVVDVSESQLPQAQKANLIALVAEAAGKSFELLTEPYVDVPLLNHSTPYDALPKIVHAILERIRVFLHSIARDVTVLATGFHGWDDIHRSNAVQAVVGDLQTAFEFQAKNVQANKGHAGFEAILTLMKQMEKAEPLRYGAGNKAMKRVYQGLGIFFLLDPWEAFGKTTVGPLIYSPVEGGFFFSLAFARSESTGLKAYEHLKKMHSQARKIIKTHECPIQLGKFLDGV